MYPQIPSNYREQIILVLGNLIVVCMGMWGLYNIIPDPSPKVGLDANKVKLILEWIELNKDLYGQMLIFNADNSSINKRLELYEKVQDFIIFYSQNVQNQPESNLALSLLNENWKTDFV